MILTLYDRQHIKLRPLHQIKDLHIDSVLSTGDKTLSFLMPGSQLRDVYTEAYISTPNDDFVIKSITPSSNGWYQIQCSLNVEELESYMDSFESVEKTMKECLDYAFLGTGWHVGICEIKKKRTIRRTNTTPWKIMQDARKTYRAEIKINSKDKVVDIYEHIGSDKGVYFAEQLNLKQLNKQVTSYDFYTQIKPIGANGLTIESVNDGDPILSNHTYSKKDKLYIWTDQRYTVAENLKADAQAKLDEMSTPLNAYSLQIIDLAKISDDYVDILSFGLGDTVTLMHESTNTFEKTRIVSLVEYPDEPNKNKCEVANSILKFEDIQQEMRDASDTINNVTTDNGTLDGSKVDSITTSQISDFDVQVQKVVDFTAIRAEIDDLRVKSATIQDLAAALARIGTLEATSVTTITLNAEIAKLNQAIIGKADITDLTSISGKITVLESSVATLDTIVNRVTTSDSIHSLVINASTAVIDNAFLKSIVSSNITVNDLLAGDISTTRFKVKSDSGNLSITDNTIQISDTNRVRVQVGKDASGDYNMYVWDKSGNLMFDATGITSKGIQRPIIVNDMVSDNANISGDKINITSVIQKINANSTLIESSHILYDGKSLDVAFGKMETSVSTVTSNVNTVTKTVTDNKTKWDTASTNATNALNTANTVTKTVSDNKSNWDKAPTALTNANNAQNTANNAQSVANSKAKVFSAQPTPPYQVGDLWVQGTSGVIMRCKTARATGSYTASDWEKADKYTDDTKANAVDTKVTTVTETVKSHSTQLTAQDGKISTLISDTTQVKKDITAVQGDITTAKGNITTLQTNYSALDQTVKGLSSTVGEHTSKLTTVTNTVNNNKANWDKAPTALDNANKAQSTANTANSKIDGLELGGINILIVKNVTKYKYLNNSGAEVTENGWFYSDYIPVKGFKNLVASGYSNLGISPSVCYYDKDKKFVKGINNNSQSLGRLMTIDSGIEYIRFSGMIVDLPTLKIEKGTKPTNYSPAPQDVDSSINTVNTRITTEIKTVTDKYASLQQDVNGFKTTVSSTYSTKTEVSKVKSDAATDATNKANQAKTDAINSANANTTTLLKSYSTTSAMNSAITQESNKITTAVASTYTTKADFNNLSIGGRNLLRKSAITSANLSLWNKSNATVTLVTEDGFNCFKIVSTGNEGIKGSGGVVTGNILIPNVRYTYSFWCKSSIDKTVGHNSIMHFQTINGSVVHNNANLQLKVTSIKANTWTKLAISFNVTKQCYFVPFIWYLGSATYFVRDIMVEEGSRDGAWTPAPEDIDASIATVDGKFKNYSTTTQMNSAITTKANEITSTVSKTYATQATVNTINGDVSALKTWKTSAETKITDTAIVNTVRNSTNYKNDLTGKVGKTEIISCINQTAETIKIDASKIELTGKVTISMLDSDTQTKVNNGNNAMSSINTNKANWDKGKTAYDWTNTNGGNMTNLRNMVLKWTNNAVSTSTYIQGGWIATNTITTAQIATGTIVIGDLDSGVQTKLNTGYDNAYKAYWMSMALSQGQSMYNDPAFLRGINGLDIYNNSNNTAVTITREAKASGWTYDTPYRIKVTSNGTTSPNHGGIRWGFTPKAGHTYLFKLIAKIPTGRTISWHTNDIGTGSKQEWLTPTAGTNDWTEYVCKVKIGTGTISTTGFFSINGGATGFSWYIVYANVFDLGSENLISTFTKGTTEIYGDYIKTGTITANHIRGNKLEGTEIVGGKISSNTTIDVTTDLKVGNNIYLNTPSSGNKYIYFNGTSQFISYNANAINVTSSSSYIRSTGGAYCSARSDGVVISNAKSSMIWMKADNTICVDGPIYTRNGIKFDSSSSTGIYTSWVDLKNHDLLVRSEDMCSCYYGCASI
ncbi:phage tail spike protein, partial [Eubacterium sp. AF05-24]|uniref:phage tail spike protein n=1 Tax=Eubacterium sp. AF05-24 TaxID=2996995 RepID=UPI0022E239AE